MWPPVVVILQEGWQPIGPLVAVLPDAAISPLPQTSLDEAFGLAVCLRAIGFGKAVLDA
jgi:hypothetical protein